MDLDPGEGVAWDAVIEAAPRGARAARGRRARRLRQDVGRQGPACRGAAEATAAGWDAVKGFTGQHRRGDGGRRARPLRRDDHQGEAQGQDPDRLSAQRARHDRGRAYSHARAPGAPSRCRSHGTSSGRRSARPISPSQRAGAARQLDADPWADFRPRRARCRKEAQACRARANSPANAGWRISGANGASFNFRWGSPPSSLVCLDAALQRVHDETTLSPVGCGSLHGLRRRGFPAFSSWPR